MGTGPPSGRLRQHWLMTKTHLWTVFIGPYEALGQFLRLAREFQVEQQTLREVQAKMKETMDDVWTQHAAAGGVRRRS